MLLNGLKYLGFVVTLFLFIGIDLANFDHYTIWPRYPFPYRMGGMLCFLNLYVVYRYSLRYFTHNVKTRFHPVWVLFVLVVVLYLIAGAFAYGVDLSMASARAKYCWTNIDDFRYMLQIFVPLLLGLVTIGIVKLRISTSQSPSFLLVLMLSLAALVLVFVFDEWRILEGFEYVGISASGWPAERMFLVPVGGLGVVVGVIGSLIPQGE